jgi:MFS family permease
MSLRPLAVSRAVLTRTLLACYGVTAANHLASVALSTLLPFHVTALGGSKTQVGLLFSVMTVVSMVLRPLAGGWIDRYGFRQVMLPGAATLVVVTLAFHVATSPVAVIALMAGIGLGNALVSTGASALTAHAGGPEHRGEALSLYFLVNSLAIAAGPPLAFALMGLGGHRAAFAAVTALAVVTTALARRLPGPAHTAGAAIAPGLRLLSRHAMPAAGSVVLTTVGHSSIYAFVPLYAVSHGQGWALVWFFTAYFVCLIGLRALLRGLSDRIGRARVIVPSMALMACGFLALALPPTPGSLIAAAAFLGGASAMLYPTLAALVVDRSPEAERALALGTLSSAWDLGVVVGSVLVGFVADRVSYGAGFTLAAVSTGLGLVAFVAAERRHRAQAAVTAPARD